MFSARRDADVPLSLNIASYLMTTKQQTYSGTEI